MKERPYSTFYARLLGGFSFSGDGQEIPIKGNLRSKYLQVLVMLLKAGKEGISKERLMVRIASGTDSRDKMMNNLRQQIFVLRRTMNGLEFPEGQYIVSVKGRYYFSRDQDVMTDTGQIDQLYQVLRSGKCGKEKRTEILREICNIYSGEFLPMLSGEEWAAAEEALSTGSPVEALDIGGKDKSAVKDYEELLASDGSLYEIFPAIETVRDVGGIELRVFIRIDKDADPASYVLTGDEKLVFLYVNGGDESVAARVNIDGYVSNFTTVRSYAALYGQEEVPVQLPADPAAPAGGASGGASGGSGGTSGGASGGTSGGSNVSEETGAPADETTGAVSDETQAPANETSGTADETETADETAGAASDETEAPADETSGTADETEAADSGNAGESETGAPADDAGDTAPDETEAGSDENTGTADENIGAADDDTAAPADDSSEAADDKTDAAFDDSGAPAEDNGSDAGTPAEDNDSTDHSDDNADSGEKSDSAEKSDSSSEQSDKADTSDKSDDTSDKDSSSDDKADDSAEKTAKADLSMSLNSIRRVAAGLASDSNADANESQPQDEEETEAPADPQAPADSQDSAESGESSPQADDNDSYQEGDPYDEEDAAAEDEDESFDKVATLSGRTYGLATLDDAMTIRAFTVSLSKIGIDTEELAEAGHTITYTIDPAGAASLVKAPKLVKDEAVVTFGVKPQIGYEIMQVTANGAELEEADAAVLASASNADEDAVYYTIPEVLEDQEVEIVLYEIEAGSHPAFKASRTINGVTVTVSAAEGILPAGTELSVEEVTTQIEDAVKEKVESEAEDGTTVTSVIAYDINLMLDGEKLDNSWSENGYVDVTFSGSRIEEMTDEASKVEVMAVDDNQQETLSAKTAGDVTAETMELEHITEQDVEGTAVDAVSFEAEHFTIYVITGVNTQDQIAVSGEPITIAIGESVKFVSDYAGYRYHEWTSSSNRIARADGESEQVTVTGVTAGTITLTHRFRDSYFSEWNTESIQVTVVDLTPVYVYVQITGDKPAYG